MNQAEWIGINKAGRAGSITDQPERSDGCAIDLAMATPEWDIFLA